MSVVNPSNQQLNNLIQKYQNKQFSEAEKIATSITHEFPKYQFAWKLLGLILFRLGKISKAVSAGQTAVTLSPKDTEAYNNLGSMLRELGEFNEAEKNHLQAIKLKPDFAESHYNLGGALTELGKFNEAEKSYRQAIKLKPDYVKAYNNLGNTLSKLGKLDEAEQIYNKALEIEPENKSILRGRGVVFYDKEKFELALKDFNYCKLEDAKIKALICLYKLGKKNEIYQKIKDEEINDSKNLNFASFSSFISYKYKEDTANNFCKNPLDFINISNLSSHIENPNSFIKKLIDELKNFKITKNPYDKATKNGFQTIPYFNIFFLNLRMRNIFEFYTLLSAIKNLLSDICPINFTRLSQ